MGTIFASTVLRTKAPLALQKPVVCDLTDRMSNWEAEVNFYHRLLTWSLFSCREADRLKIEAFLAQVNRLRSVDLPALKEQLRFVQIRLDHALNQAWQETNVLRERFNNFDQNLQQLKLRIFCGFPQCNRVEIW